MMDRINQDQLDLFEGLNFDEHSNVEGADLDNGEGSIVNEKDQNDNNTQ